MANSHIRVDSVRASRDGHEFHEAWVARKSLGLLLPRDAFVGIAIEGFSPGDKAAKEATEIADAVLYYGRYASFKGATRVVVVQVKYSKASENKPFRATDAKYTIAKFAKTYRALKRDHGTAKARSRLRFELVTNRPIHPELTQAIQAVSKGLPMHGVVKAQAQQLQVACKLRGKDLAEFVSRLQITGVVGDLTTHKQQLAIAVADWSPARDSLARLRLNLLCNLARTKASLIAQDRNVITRADILTALEVAHEDDLLPCPASFPEVGEIVERLQLADVAKSVPGLTRPLIVHADAGVGKTVFMRSLASRLAADHEVVLFDCFGSGQYRAPSDARHLPQRGLIHIANLLACQGLCDPLLPGPNRDDELIRIFCSRLAQAAETGRRADPGRQLVLLVDAIDNASEHATFRGETAFPKLLVEQIGIAGAIPGVQIIVSSRTHRREKATGAIPCEEVELRPFTLDETRGYLRPRVDGLTEAKLQVAQSRSRGNARVLEHLAKDDPGLLAPTEFEKVIELDDLLRKRIDDALGEARRQGYQDSEVRSFLAGLATLPPPVPIQEFSEVNGVSEGAVNSFAADLAPLLEQTKHGLMFRDEPTETLIRETYAADKETLRMLALNLNGMQAKSLYAATTLPELLQQLGDGQQLFDLAFDDRLPATLTSAAGKQAIRQARIRAAVAYAAQHDEIEHLVRLLVELSTITSVNQRGTQYLLDHPDLTVNAGDVDSLRRLFEARTDWPGTRHARLAIAHVLTGDLADAHRHAQRVYEWQRHYFDQDDEGRARKHGPTALDMASLPLCLLARGEGEAAAHEMASWYDWFGYEVATHLFAFIRAAQAKGLIAAAAVRQFLTSKAIKPGILAAAIAQADGDAPLQCELVAALAKTCHKANYGEQHYRPHERPIIRGMLRAATVAMVLGMRDESIKISAAAKLPIPALHTFMDEYWTGDIYPYIAIQVLGCLAQGLVPEERHLLPRELAEISATLPGALKGNDFRDALKKALQDSHQKASSEPEATRRLSYETKSSAERSLTAA
ncbi:NACHT domain-containing protein [Pseudoxanthomonas mexicana]|uniref:NACHT domain-containing protein n=1 Tax=Pseudoxanthomonas mexicana TaxID=128785 RepID=UPI00398B4521